MNSSLPEPDQTLMYAESGESAQVLERQLERNEAVISELASTLKRTPPRVIVTCARGSSDHAATFAKYALETQLGIVTASSSLSVGSVYETRLDMRDGLFLAISQSGKSPDLLRNAEVARAGGARVVALVNDTSSPLASLADVSIGLQAGPERSVAATKSYLGTLTSVLHLIARWKDDAALLAALQALPDAMRQASVQDWSALVEGLAYARNLFVLGRGFGLGAAQEAALKFKETSGLHAEAFSSAEVKHGPMALIGRGFPVLALGQDDGTLPGTLAAVKELSARGARVWCAAPGSEADTALPIVAAPHPLCAPILAIQSFYRAANALSLRRGHNPDLPPHLNKVTETV